MMKAILLGSILALTSASTALAETVTMTLRGTRQGDIQGGGNTRARDGAIECASYQSEIQVPTNIITGTGAGRRQIAPIKCIKRLDRATPLLLNALVNNESLTNVTFRFSQVSPDGTQAVVYTVTLRDALLSGIRQFLDAAGTVQEELSFSYQQATVTFEPGITAEIPR